MQTFLCHVLHDSPPPCGQGAALQLNRGAHGGNRARAAMGQGGQVFHGALQFGAMVSANATITGIAKKINLAVPPRCRCHAPRANRAVRCGIAAGRLR